MYFKNFDELLKCAKELCPNLFKTIDMTRQEANREIINFIAEKEILDEVFINPIKELIEKWPNQRFGQIMCNYACPDYREAVTTSTTKLIMNKLFKDFKYDPFYEESTETLERLQYEYSKKN